MTHVSEEPHLRPLLDTDVCVCVCVCVCVVCACGVCGVCVCVCQPRLWTWESIWRSLGSFALRPDVTSVKRAMTSPLLMSNTSTWW